MKKIKFYGGFHNSPEITINVSDDVARELNSENCMRGIRELLTPYQEKKLDRHFCGIKGCMCGGLSRAKYEIL